MDVSRQRQNQGEQQKAKTVVGETSVLDKNGAGWWQEVVAEASLFPLTTAPY